MPTAALNWTAAIAISTAFLIAAQAMDGPSDIEASRAASMARDDAIHEAIANAAALERQAWAECARIHGDNAVVLMLRETGDYVCRQKQPEPVILTLLEEQK